MDESRAKLKHGAEIAVRCRGVTKEFGSGTTTVQALRGVDLEIYTGEMTLLVGPSGCGKTTLLSVIAGILEPTSGSVEVLGSDLVHMLPSQVVRFRGEKIGFVFQQFNLLPAAGVKRRIALAHAEEVLTQVGLADRMHALPSDLSGGQQQRVAIARALSHHPQLLVCDEPTSALDHANGKLIMELLRDIAVESNRAVIVVTHDARVFEFGDRIAHMDDGHIERVEERAVAVGD
jgi:putative ABC transport system ATP-binding protein